MKRTLLVVGIALVTVSCGKSKGEQMLYDYQQASVKSNLNMDLEDLAFDIKEVKEVGKITSSDSAAIYKEKLGRLYYGEDALQEDVDTLTYEYVITYLDTVVKQYQELILLNIQVGREHRNYEYKQERNKMIDARTEAEIWKMYSDSYRKNLDSVLSTKYLATYSINNPMLNNNKQTFDKYFYSNPENTKFIKEEMVPEASPEK